jgi:hypothetical protein
MSEENKSFRVNDRRRFDEDGNERDSSSESRSSVTGQHNPESQETKAPQVPTPNQPPSGAGAEQDGPSFVMKDNPKGSEEEGTGLSFSSFLMSLATQALMQMGEMEPPGGIKLPPDFEAAKQTIEVIGMLAVKTKGNLDAEEQRLLVEVLHSLRLTFVQRVKAAMGAAGVNPQRMAQAVKR